MTAVTKELLNEWGERIETWKTRMQKVVFVPCYEVQVIDCNCNDCIFMKRDVEKLKQHKKSYEGTGLMDDVQFGDCAKFNKPISFIPNVCQPETQECFVHRKDTLKKT